MIIGDSTPVSDATLGIPGTIKAAIPVNADFQNGYMYVPGTTINADLSGASGFVVLDSVPSGTIPVIYYAVKNGEAVQAIRYDVQVFSGDTSRVLYPDWRYSRQVYFNTTPSGANVAGTITNFPVLVRLTGANFAFAGARADGGDVRFAKQDGTLLNYEIERWDAAQGSAEIWVKIDTIFGNNSDQCIYMYWGLSAMDSAGSSQGLATGNSNGAAVFDTSNGFQGVWHFAEAGNAPAHDATANGFQAAAYGMTAASAVSGLIGTAREFDGKTSYFAVPGSASSALNFPGNGSFSLSAWVFADSLDNSFHEIISKGDLDYGMQLHNINKWEITDFLDATGWQTVRSPATAQTWKYVVGVRDGTREYLYIDGVLASDSIALRDSTGRNEAFDLCIGRQADASSRYWNGAIDEVNMANVARSPDWIKLSYMNQKTVNQLVEFR
jgi:biopolymer transport protein ExbB